MSHSALSGQQFEQLRLFPQHAEQLPMFMSSHEIRQGYKPLPADHESEDVYDSRGMTVVSSRKETSPELWERKAEEADSSGLTNELRENGVKTPVPLNVTSRNLANGHHRVAAMGDVDPHQLMPVQHFEDHELASSYGVYLGGKNAHHYAWDY